MTWTHAAMVGPSSRSGCWGKLSLANVRTQCWWIALPWNLGHADGCAKELEVPLGLRCPGRGILPRSIWSTQWVNMRRGSGCARRPPVRAAFPVRGSPRTVSGSAAASVPFSAIAADDRPQIKGGRRDRSFLPALGSDLLPRCAAGVSDRPPMSVRTGKSEFPHSRSRPVRSWEAPSQPSCGGVLPTLVTCRLPKEVIRGPNSVWSSFPLKTARPVVRP